MDNREKVAQETIARAREVLELSADFNEAHNHIGEAQRLRREAEYCLAALSAMQGDGWRQEVHTALLNAAHELRATAPFIGGSGQVDMLAVADQCIALTLPELPTPPSAHGDEGEGA